MFDFIYSRNVACRENLSLGSQIIASPSNVHRDSSNSWLSQYPDSPPEKCGVKSCLICPFPFCTFYEESPGIDIEESQDEKRKKNNLIPGIFTTDKRLYNRLKQREHRIKMKELANNQTQNDKNTTQDSKITISCRISPELHTKAKIFCIENHPLTLQDLTGKALEEYMRR
jgi:hypothetical protein